MSRMAETLLSAGPGGMEGSSEGMVAAVGVMPTAPPSAGRYVEEELPPPQHAQPIKEQEGSNFRESEEEEEAGV